MERKPGRGMLMDECESRRHGGAAHGGTALRTPVGERLAETLQVTLSHTVHAPHHSSLLSADTHSCVWKDFLREDSRLRKDQIWPGVGC